MPVLEAVRILGGGRVRGIAGYKNVNKTLNSSHKDEVALQITTTRFFWKHQYKHK